MNLIKAVKELNWIHNRSREIDGEIEDLEWEQADLINKIPILKEQIEQLEIIEEDK